MSEPLCLRYNLFWCEVFGIRPNKSKQYITRLLHNIHSIVIVTFLIIILSTHYADIIYYGTDAAALSENLRASIPVTIAFIKFFICQTKPMLELINYVQTFENEVMKQEDKRIKEIFWGHLKIADWVSKFFFRLGICTMTVMIFLVPMLYEYQHPLESLTVLAVDNITLIYLPRALPFRGIFPFDKYKYYKTTFTIQILTFTCGGCTVMVTDMLAWTLMIFGIVHIKILLYKIQEFKDRALRDGTTFNWEDGEIMPLREEAMILDYLKSCVVEHRHIVKFIGNLNSEFQNVMLLASVLTSLELAVLGYGYMVSEFDMNQLFQTGCVFVIVTQLFCNYWFANEILILSEDITIAIWESKWYECSPRVRKMLLFILMKCKQPIQLYLGHLYVMSTKTMLSILKTGGSYFALMQQLYNK